MNIDDVSRQRLDFTTGPKGETIATLTITLPDGSIQRFTASADEAELDRFAETLAHAEVKGLNEIGALADLDEIEIGSLFGDIAKGIGKAVKGTFNAAKKIAASKVFRSAGQALTAAGPAIPPPFGPAALAVGGGMQVAHKVAAGAVAAEAGAKQAARLLASSAKREARKYTGTTKAARGLVRWGNSKRKAAFRVAEGKKGRKRRGMKLPDAKGWAAIAKLAKEQKKGKAKRSKRRTKTTAKTTAKRADPVQAARAGKLRSNKPGAVTTATLLRAANEGRVFWVS